MVGITSYYVKQHIVFVIDTYEIPLYAWGVRAFVQCTWLANNPNAKGRSRLSSKEAGHLCANDRVNICTNQDENTHTPNKCRYYVQLKYLISL